jgi:lambda family phage portal protein
MVNPFLAAARRNAKSQQRNYAAGAQFSRLNSEWIRASSSIDQEARSDLRILRGRARTLVRDNEHARAVVRILATNIIGAHGIRPIPMNEGADGELAKKANAAIVRAWRTWCHAEHASTDTRHAFAELERQIVKGIVTDGEAIVRIWDGFDNPFGFALEIIDPDLLDEQFNRGPDQFGNEIRMGVEVDRYHRPVAYHLYTRHPAEPGFRNNDRVCVPASEIRHLFVPLRPGQTRGISWFACVLLNAKMLAGYTEAELVAARSAAAKMGFFETALDAGESFQMPVDGEMLTMDGSPGLATQLPPGMTFKEWDPKHPSTAFDTFVSAILRAQAVGLGVSYMTLTGDLAKTSFSSAKVGLMPERDMFEEMQVWIAEHLHRAVYRAWLPIAMLTPFLSLPSFDPARWMEVRFQGRRWPWIDGLKEIEAAGKELALGINSRQNICRSLGRDFETMLEEQAHEYKLAKLYDVDISGATVTAKEDGLANDEEDSADEEESDTAPPQKVANEKPARALRRISA